MGVKQSKHSYVYKPKKKLRKKTLHNSIFMEKPEYLVYDDVTLNNSIDDNSKYNTTKSCIDITAIQKRREHAARPLSLDEDMLERPPSNISNVMYQYRQEVAGQIARIRSPVSETVSGRSQGSSDGFKDVYDDDYFDNQMDSGNFMDARSYHSLEFDTVRPTEVDGTTDKLNRSAEFEFERVGSKKLSRRSSSRRVERKAEVAIILAKEAAPDVSTTSSSKTDLPPSELPQIETVRQISTESNLEDPVTPQEIITLEDVTNILQDIKDKILHGDINDTEVYHQLLMCKKKAQGIHVTSIKIRAKKTMLIGKINKFIHWFAIAEPKPQEPDKENIQESTKEISETKMENTSKVRSQEDVENHYENNLLEGSSKVGWGGAEGHYENDLVEGTSKVGLAEEEQEVENREAAEREDNGKLDARTTFIVNTMKEKQTSRAVDDIDSTKQRNNPFIDKGSTKDQQIYENEEQAFVDTTNYLVQTNNTAEQEDVMPPLNVYEEINNIRVLLQEVHGKMDAFTGVRYDLVYHNIIDEVFQARIILNNVKGTHMLEDTIIEEYEKFFESLLLYFEDLVNRNESTYENAVPDEQGGQKSVRFDQESNIEYYIDDRHQLSDETSTNLSEAESRTNFVSLTEYDGNVIQTCETFNKTIELQEDDGDSSADDDFMYQTNAVGQIVFEHEESPQPYIVDPISFSKCRMRPLSIIQEQLDEYVDCNYQENQLVDQHDEDDVQESEDRDDFDSFDENMVKKTSDLDAEDDELKDFEEIEKNIDSTKNSMPDLVLIGQKNHYQNHLQEEHGDITVEQARQFDLEEALPKSQTKDTFEEERPRQFELEQMYPESQTEHTLEEVLPGNHSETVDQYNHHHDEPEDHHNSDDPPSPMQEEQIPNESEKVDRAPTNQNVVENDFYSLESMSPEENSTEKVKYENFTIKSELGTAESQEKQFVDPQEEQPTEHHLSAHTEDIDQILNLSNYNFTANELESYHKIMKINAIIDNLQSQIDRFSGTKTTPEYMSTFKQIFDNMRLLNTIDNCDYQEDILNLIDYTSDKIQKCIFELDLKVS